MATGQLARRAAIYCRVSTDQQTTENQERELRALAERSGYEVVEVYTDAGISGAKGRDQRPAFDRLCRDATARRFNVVMAWSVDRIGRSLQHLVGFLNEIHALKIDLVLLQSGVDTTTPGGKAMFQMMGVFAEFERSMIRERIMAGLERARDKPNPEKKKIGRPATPAYVRRAVLADLAAGMTQRAIGRKHDVDAATVSRIKRASA